MKIACPNCTQHLKVDRSWSGKSLPCPTCNTPVNVPIFLEEEPSRPAPPPRAVRAGRRQTYVHNSPHRLLTWGLSAAVVASLAGVAVWYLSSLRQDSAAKVAAATAESVAPVAEIPSVADASETEAAEEEAVPVMDAVAEAVPSVEEAPSDAQLIARLMAKRELWPDQISLTKNARFPAMFRGAKVGEVAVPPGTKVDLVAIKPELVEVRFRDGVRHLPHDATNLAELAKTADGAAVSDAGSSARRQAPPVRPKDLLVGGTSSAPPQLVAAAAKIDTLIAAHHAKNKLAKPVLVNNERFLRRAYLTAIGRIPTAEEAEVFLADKDPRKRANLVASLFKSPGYTSHMSNWMFDRLRIVDYNNVAQIRYPNYRQWVRQAVQQDVPWDKMVTTLLTTSGGGWDEESAAIGYFTRDRGMPFDNLAVTMRIFLGSRMECAQCHNDPFGDTKQKDFLRLAAFTHGLEPMKQNLFYPTFREMDAMPQTSTEHNAAWMFWRDVYGSSLAGGGTGRITLPADYEYKDGRPGDIEGARAPFGKVTNLAGTRDRDDGREKFAGWITQGTGDRFAGMIANGMWKRVMGAGYFEPGDEYLEPAETHDAAISAHLAGLMTELRYSLRDFQQALMLTEAFQYEPNPGASSADGGADDFRGRRVQRMTAEQVWDSLVTLVSGNPDDQPPRKPDERIFINGAPVLEGQMTMAQLSRDVMAIENEKDLRKYFMDFVEKVKADRGSEGGQEGPAARMRRDPVGFVRGMLPRAADLDSPAPRNHFVSLFGQSNRNVVDGSTREPNVGQVLSLMNGFVQTELVNKADAHLNLDVNKASSAEDKIRQLYLGILSREPSSDEAALMAKEFSASPTSAAANVASAMIMSAEFLYIQ